MTREHFYEVVRCVLLFFLLCMLGVCFFYYKINAELKNEIELLTRIAQAEKTNSELQEKAVSVCHSTLISLSNRLGINPDEETVSYNEALASANIRFGGVGGVGGGFYPIQKKKISRRRKIK